MLPEVWRAAASDLGIRVTTPFYLIDVDGSRVEFIAHLPDFGAANGTLLCEFDDWQSLRQLAKKNDYYLSGLEPSSYDKYDRAQIIETLRDFGWVGKGRAPGWLE